MKERTGLGICCSKNLAGILCRLTLPLCERFRTENLGEITRDRAVVILIDKGQSFFRCAVSVSKQSCRLT